MKLGYARVSTVGQDLKTQQEKLEKYGVQEDYLFVEKKSGTTTRNREALELLLKQCRQGDHLYITKIDRLARSIMDLNKLTQQFQERGVTVTFIDDNMTFEAEADKNPMQKLLFNVLGSFAEFERDMIVNRTSEGRKRAVEAGKTLGRKGRPGKDIERGIELMAKRQENKLSVADIVKMVGVPKATLYKKIKEKMMQESSGSTYNGGK